MPYFAEDGFGGKIMCLPGFQVVRWTSIKSFVIVSGQIMFSIASYGMFHSRELNKQ